MIIKEFYETRFDGVNLYRTFSDLGKQIQQLETGNVYDEAIDIEDAEYTYIEIENLIEDNISAEEAINILLGVNNNESFENTEIEAND